MLGVIFGAMAVMLVLTVPIGVMLLAVALIPSLMDPGFMATVPFVLRNVVGGLNSTPLLAIPLFILGGIIMSTNGKRIDASVASELEHARIVLKEENDGGEC